MVHGIDSIGSFMFWPSVINTELDFLVEYTMKYNEILGSRMMGGGFGGCTLSLIKDSFIIEFIEVIKKEYFSKFKRKLNPIIANLNQGIQISLN